MFVVETIFMVNAKAGNHRHHRHNITTTNSPMEIKTNQFNSSELLSMHSELLRNRSTSHTKHSDLKTNHSDTVRQMDIIEETHKMIPLMVATTQIIPMDEKNQTTIDDKTNATEQAVTIDDRIIIIVPNNPKRCENGYVLILGSCRKIEADTDEDDSIVFI